MTTTDTDALTERIARALMAHVRTPRAVRPRRRHRGRRPGTNITSYALGVATIPALVAVWVGLVILEDGLSPRANDTAYGCARCRRWWGRGSTSDGKWVARAKRRWHTRTAHRQETDR